MIACAICGQDIPVLENAPNTTVTCPRCNHQQKAEGDADASPAGTPPGYGMSLYIGFALSGLGILGMILGIIALFLLHPWTTGLSGLVSGMVLFALGAILLIVRQIARQTWRGWRYL